MVTTVWLFKPRSHGRKMREERRGTPAGGFAVAWTPLGISRSALFPLRAHVTKIFLSWSEPQDMERSWSGGFSWSQVGSSSFKF